MIPKPGFLEAVHLRFRLITLANFICAFAVLGVLSAAMPLVMAQARAQSAGAVVIARIDVQGNQRIEALTVQSYMTIAAGDPYDPAGWTAR